MKTVLCVVGTRPEAIKMAPVIQAFRQSDWAETIVLSTGQHRELLRQTLGEFAVAVDADLEVMQANQTLETLTSNLFRELPRVFDRYKPDLVLAQGDTTTVMVAALCCFYRNVAFGHVEAGLRTFDIRSPFPEEMNRVVASRVADLHFCPTESSRDNLMREHIPADRVHVTGNTVIDALLWVSAKLEARDHAPPPESRTILVTAHRRENFGAPILAICAAIRELHDRFPDVDFVYPVHPNPNIKDVVGRELGGLERVALMEPLGYSELVAAMKRSFLVLTDSGGIQEEAPALAKPVLVMRDVTERPEAVDAGVVKLVGPHRERIVAEVSRLLTDPVYYGSMAKGVSPYGDGHASERILRLCRDFLDGRG